LECQSAADELTAVLADETRTRWLSRFAIKYDLEYLVVPNSYHEPGDTIRILFGHEEWCPDLMPWPREQSGDGFPQIWNPLEGRIGD